MREKRTFIIPPPNQINRRVTLISGVARHEAVWDGPAGLLASITATLGRTRIALVLDGLVIDAEGATMRDAYRRAWHEVRVERARRNIEGLLEQRARRWRSTKVALATLGEALREAWAAGEHDQLTIKRLEVENDVLKAQAVERAREMQALRDQLAAGQRAPEEVTARLQKAEQRLQAMQIKLSGALAHQATTQGRADAMAKQLGVPASADLAVRGPESRVYPLASQATRDGAAAGEAVRS